MSSPRFITSRIFLFNLLLAIVLFALLLFLTLKGIQLYTKHGQANPVPEFTGMLPEEAAKEARQHDLNIEIVDSLFLEDAAPGVVVDQIPEAGHGVKENRTIFITINSTQPEMVTLPQVTDISFRQALVLIENSGLQVGNISYKPSEYNELVLNVQIDSTNIYPGKKLPKNSKIDLVVGTKKGNLTTPLPDLIGLTIDQAQSVLTDAMLNTGVIIYDESILTQEDSLSARIWRQKPNTKVTGFTLLGSSVDMWATVDQLKLEDALDPDFQ